MLASTLLVFDPIKRRGRGLTLHKFRGIYGVPQLSIAFPGQLALRSTTSLYSKMIKLCKFVRTVRPSVSRQF